MRLSRIVLVFAPFLLLACAESPRCIDPSPASRPNTLPPEAQCNAGKVAVCGNDPAQLYGMSGALLPVPSVSDSPSGSCDGVSGPCRPRPVCGEVGGAATCANDQGATCVLGSVSVIPPTVPTPDSGPPPQDSGPPEEDAGPPDEDAGTDAGGAADDAGSDAG